MTHASSPKPSGYPPPSSSATKYASPQLAPITTEALFLLPHHKNHIAEYDYNYDLDQQTRVKSLQIEPVIEHADEARKAELMAVMERVNQQYGTAFKKLAE